MADYLPDLASIILGSAGFIFGFYQLRRREKAELSLAELKARHAEALESRARRYEVYRSALDTIKSLRPKWSHSSEALHNNFASTPVRPVIDRWSHVHEMAEACIEDLNDEWHYFDRNKDKLGDMHMVASESVKEALDRLIEAGSWHREIMLESYQEMVHRSSQGGGPKGQYDVGISDGSREIGRSYKRYSDAYEGLERAMRRDLAEEK